MPPHTGPWWTRGLGLRVQIVVSLAVLMGVVLGLLAMGTHALLPGVVDREVGAARIEMARVVARDLARTGRDAAAARAAVRGALTLPGVTGAAVWDAGSGLTASGSLPSAPPFPGGTGPAFTVARVVDVDGGWAAVEHSPDHSASAAIRVATGGEGDRTRTLEAMLLGYFGLSALAILVFGYISLTRLIVRPIEKLTNAARRLGSGAQEVKIAPSGGRELIDLAGTFNAMASEVEANRRAMEEKIGSLERLNRELERAQEQVIRSAKLASVGQLAAGVAHEIGNPLTVMLGAFEVLDSVEPIAPEAREYLARMRHEADRVNKIIRDLLEYARASPETVEPTSVQAVVDSTVTLMAPQKPFRTVEIQAAIPEDVPMVMANGDRLRQVLVNLLMNAAEAFDERGGTISISGGIAQLPGGRAAVRITVSDTGPGIPKGILGTVFDPFVTTKAPGKGTGLGLAVCQGIVDGLGGTIRVENPAGGGARFEILLPAVESEDGSG